MNIIAFDPGQKGGIAIHSQGITTACPMPLAGKTLDLPSIADLVRSHSPSIAVIEKVGAMPGQGVTSTFTFGMGYGQLQGLLSGMGVPFELVTPQAWKKLILAGTAKDKDAAIEYCRRAFPKVSLVPPRCRTPHDGIADALCLLQYGLREFARPKPIENIENVNDILEVITDSNHRLRLELGDKIDSLSADSDRVQQEIKAVWTAIGEPIDRSPDKKTTIRKPIGFLSN